MALPVLAIGPILKAVGGFFRAIPLWAWLAFAVLAAAFVYGETKEAQGMERGLAKGLAERDKVKANWDQAVARGREEIARLDRENAAAEAKAKAEAQAIGENRRRDLQDAIANRDRTISDLRTGNLRLRQQWRGCVSQAEGGSTAGGAGRAASPEGLRPGDPLDLAGAVAGSAFVGEKATADVTALQAVVRSQQEFMLRVCPVTLSSR